MVDLVTGLRLAGYALGALGAGLIFIEFFQTPTYISYDPDFGNYSLSVSPSTLDEYTWAGRIGAFLVAVAFALLFLATLLA